MKYAFEVEEIVKHPYTIEVDTDENEDDFDLFVDYEIAEVENGEVESLAEFVQHFFNKYGYDKVNVILDESPTMELEFY